MTAGDRSMYLADANGTLYLAEPVGELYRLTVERTPTPAERAGARCIASHGAGGTNEWPCKDCVDAVRLAEAVAAGAEFMDAIDANVTDDAERWFWVVNPDTLDMSQSTRGHRRECGCIFGQHSPDGFYYPEDYELVDREAVDLGFDRSSSGPFIEYAALTALWVEEINERRAAWFDRHPEAAL